MPSELTPQEFERLTNLLEESKQRKATAAGALQEQMRQARKEFGCKTLDEMKAKLELYSRKKRRLGKEAKKLYDEIMKQYRNKLNED